MSDDDDTTVHPTHRCFDDVTEFLNELAATIVGRGGSLDDVARGVRLYTVVHGIIRGDHGGPIAHAWLERDGRVYHAGIIQGQFVRYSVDRAEYVEKAMVWDETRYTVDESAALFRKFGPPPWVSEYRKLCSDFKNRCARSGR